MAANATAVWRVRPSGSNTNGGGYDAGISSPGTDYSQQNAAQVTQSSTANTSTSTTTLTDTGASFTSALIGNGIRVAGTGITTTFTFVTAVPTSTTLTLQTSPGTTGTAVSYNIGGGWATVNSSNLSTTGPLVPGNTVYILGSGIPTRGSTTTDYSIGSTYVQVAQGDQSTGGLIVFAGDPATPSYSSGGMPSINAGGMLFYQSSRNKYTNLFIIASGTANAGTSLGIISTASNSYTVVDNCTLDQNGYDIPAFAGDFLCTNTEIYSSAAKRTTNTLAGVYLRIYGSKLLWCNIHQCIGPNMVVDSGSSLIGCIISKSRGGDGIQVSTTSVGLNEIDNCTVDGNAGHGIVVNTQAALAQTTLRNNIISNHTGAGKYGLTVSAGTTAQNDRVKMGCNNNVYYNNTADVNAISYGANDTHGGANPFVDQANDDYTLTAAYIDTGYPTTKFPGY